LKGVHPAFKRIHGADFLIVEQLARKLRPLRTWGAEDMGNVE
jgi:hypothetical protein